MSALALVERKIEGANRTALAVEVGVTRGFVSLVLSGKREPSLPVAARLSEALGIRLDEFYRVWSERKAA
jgi:transcriptional regulator with XRE-family HTH domain